MHQVVVDSSQQSATGGTQQQGQTQTGVGKASSLDYSIPGTLHFIQAEWKRFERERNEWEVERSDLRSRLALLEGERKAMENLKLDLVRRVKMLELALKAERAKSLAPVGNPSGEGAVAAPDSVVPNTNNSLSLAPSQSQYHTIRKTSSAFFDGLDGVLMANPSGTLNFAKGFAHSRSREILKSYLIEADSLLAATKIAIVDRPQIVTSTIAHSVIKTDEQSVPVLQQKHSLTFDTGKPPIGAEQQHHVILNNHNNQENNNGRNNVLHMGNLPSNFEIEKSSTIKAERTKKPVVPKGSSAIADTNGTNRSSSPGEVNPPSASPSPPASISSDATDVNSYHYTNGVKSSVVYASQKWIPQPPLRSHYDSIRSVSFHPTDLSIVTGSEDNTVKIWRITPNSVGKENESKLVHTYRGHSATVTSVALSPIEDICFSSGMDSTINVWALPSLSKAPYEPHDTSCKLHTLIGHSDAVWEVHPHTSSPLLLSCSADGSLKLWDVNSSNSSLKSTLWYNGSSQSVTSDFESPTSTCWINGSSSSLLAAYKNSVVKMFDSQTRANVLTFASNSTFDGSSQTQINKVISHPTLPLIVTAHEDGFIRILDINSGKVVNDFPGSSVGPLASSTTGLTTGGGGIRSISISADGQFLLSGGHDGLLTWWDFSNQKVLQQQHHEQLDIWSVAHHKQFNDLCASGGRDACCWIFNSSSAILHNSDGA